MLQMETKGNLVRSKSNFRKKKKTEVLVKKRARQKGSKGTTIIVKSWAIEPMTIFLQRKKTKEDKTKKM